MKREDITKHFPEATKEQIDALLDIHSTDIGKTRQKLEAERDNYKQQLDTAQEALKGFEDVDVADLRGRIDTLTANLAAQESEYKAKIADMEFRSVLEAAITGSKAKNARAVTALLDVENLKASKNQSEDIKAAIEKVKAENDFLFQSDEPFQNPFPVGETHLNKGVSPSIAKEAFAKMSYRDRLALKKSDPAKYNELKG